MNLTVAGNMTASLAAYAGQVAALAVVAVNSTATVTGSPTNTFLDQWYIDD